MTIITRRAALGGLVALPASAGFAETNSGRNGVDPASVAPDALDAWRTASGARERAIHHLQYASLALDELVNGENERWMGFLCGDSPFSSRSFTVTRFILQDDPDIANLKIEKSEDVLRWKA